MKPLLLINRYSPGDVLVLTAAVRDLHRAYPGAYQTAVDTACPDVWAGNPHVVPADALDPNALRIDCGHPPMLDRCNGSPRHYVESMHEVIGRAIGRDVPLGRFAPDVHLSDEERAAPRLGIEKPYWLVVAGGKRDLTAKWWPAAFYQRVVDGLGDRARLVQAGAAGDHHPPLRGLAANVVGQTTLRQFLCLIYHADGVVCPVTAAMHAAAAFDKPCVVLAGGREPPHWETYPGHQFLHTVGQLPCCQHGGCWKARVVPLGDGDGDRDRNLCILPAAVEGQPTATCMKMIEPQDVVRAVERYLRGNQLKETSNKGDQVVVNESNSVQQMEAAVAALPPYPGGYEGRGIVIPGGGHRYFPCAWVCINMLREVGCTLPIELWHLGPAEMTAEMRALVEPLGVRCVDAFEVRRNQPVRRLEGWELKAYAILHSKFREVLLLDADNFPVIDPAFLFDAPQYRTHGAIFWPDYGPLAPSPATWKLAGMPYRSEPPFESGQIVVDKQRCWRPLALTMWMNEHSDFWYRHIHGDKDTFHLSWRKLEMDYAMVPYPIRPLERVMCQHDFAGQLIFQHRNMAKWTLVGRNPQIAGFQREEEGLAFLEGLRRQWHARPNHPYREEAASEEEKRIAKTLCGQRWVYRRVGYDERTMRFALNGTVIEGSGRCERTWGVQRAGDDYAIAIGGEGVITCHLAPCREIGGGGGWQGQWETHERMPVELVPETHASNRLAVTLI